MRRLLILLALLLPTSLCSGKPIARNAIWPAEWIAVPGAPTQDYGVYYFRKTLDLQAKPEHLAVYVSADNRYQLYVNGVRVSCGPARGDLTH
jgi:alpha-L-rhamnosidase